MGVPPQNALVEGIDFPPPAALWRAIALPSASTSPASGRGKHVRTYANSFFNSRTACGHIFAFPRRDAPGFCHKLSALSNQRARGMPGARAPDSRVCMIV